MLTKTGLLISIICVLILSSSFSVIFIRYNSDHVPDDNDNKINTYEKRIIEINATLFDSLSPSLFGDTLVWVGVAEDSTNYNLKDLFMYNIESGELKQLTNGKHLLSSDAINIYKDIITWGDPENNVTNIYNISNNYLRTIPYYSHTMEQFEYKLVWVNYRNDTRILNIYDINTNSNIEMYNPNYTNSFSFYNNLVAYRSKDETNGISIHLLNIETGEDIELINSINYLSNFEIFEDKIAWNGYFNEEGDSIYDSYIHIFDIKRNEEIKIPDTLINTDDFDFYDNKIVCKLLRDEKLNIYLYDIIKDIEEKILGSEGGYHPIISEKYVVYITYGTSLYDYGMHLNIYNLHSKDTIIFN